MEEVTVDDVLSVTNVFSDLVMLFVVLDVVAIFIMLFLEKYDPRVFVTWLILLIFLPPVGFILYLYMGATFYNRHRFTPKNITTSDDRANMVYAIKVAVENDGYLKLGMYGDVKF